MQGNTCVFLLGVLLLSAQINIVVARILGEDIITYLYIHSGRFMTQKNTHQVIQLPTAGTGIIDTRFINCVV
jgi:hypothetical protein